MSPVDLTSNLEIVPGKRIGLLGGSFNPAHEGHLYISTQALRRLRLDEVIWLVSPQNPLKPTSGMAPLSERLSAASKLVEGHRIRATDIEKQLGTVYTAETLLKLKKCYPGVHFVWLMGADNFLQIGRWYNWRTIFRSVPVAIFSRPKYSRRAKTSKAARRFARFRVSDQRATTLAVKRPPAWVFFNTRLDTTSATRIRNRA